MSENDEDSGTGRRIARGCMMFVVGLIVFAMLVFGVCAIMMRS
jgi:hypothetical protein